MLDQLCNERVLVVVAHPDDEVLGCGGTIAKLASMNHEVHALYLSDGVGARFDNHAIEKRDALFLEARDTRRRASQKAAQILGIRSQKFSYLPDNRLDTVPLLEVVQIVEEAINIVNPTILFTHHSADLNIDHRTVFNAVSTAIRPQPSSCLKIALSFEVLSSTEWQPPCFGNRFSPSFYIDVTSSIDKKLDALNAYEMELREHPHPRSPMVVSSLATLRGAESGFLAAEGFMVLRQRVW